MPRYRLTIAYEGTDFHGWQKQYVREEIAPKRSIVERDTGREGFVQLRTVQWAIEEAVLRVYRERVHIQGASRTDSGVHARAQTAAFTVTGENTSSGGPPIERLAMALNSRLPEDVVVTECALAHDAFDPIRECEAKGYRYTVLTGPTRPLWDRRTMYHTHESLDIAPMRVAAKLIEGEHDFAAFAQASHGRESTVRTVFECAVHALPSGAVAMDVSGNGFLYNMVRIIAGTLVGVGRGRIDLDRVREALETGERRLAGQTLPPEGLCLMWMRYAGQVNISGDDRP